MADNMQDKIKKESAEDASSYYAQGDKHDEHDYKSEYSKPLPPIDSEKEEFNLVRTLSYLAFGGAALALVFILFFINKKVDSMSKEVLAPFKKEVGEHLLKLTESADKLQNRVEVYEKNMMIMELKKALATVEGISTIESSPEVKNKSAVVASSIQSLLDELGAKPSVAPEAVPTEGKPAEGAAPAPPAAPEAKPGEPAAGGAPATTDAKPAPAAGTPDTKPAEATAPAAPAPAAIAAPAPAAPVAAPKADVKAAAGKKAASDDDDDEDD